MNDHHILCPHCGKDITKAVHSAVASFAAKASHKNRDTNYYREISEIRWAKERAKKKAPEAKPKRESE